MTGAKSDPDALYEASQIIDRFGGIRPMSNKIHVPVTTIQGWKKRGMIPGARRAEILHAARENGIDLSDLLESVSPPANENADSLPIRLKEDALTPSAKAWHGMKDRRRAKRPPVENPTVDDPHVEDPEGRDEDEERDLLPDESDEDDAEFDPESFLNDEDDEESGPLSPRKGIKDLPGQTHDPDESDDLRDEEDDEEDGGFARHKESQTPSFLHYRRGAPSPEDGGPVSVMQDKPYGEGELSDLMDRIKTVEVRGGRHMTLIASALIAAALAFTMFVFWPRSAPESGPTPPVPLAAVEEGSAPAPKGEASGNSSKLYSNVKGAFEKLEEESSVLKGQIESGVKQAQDTVAALTNSQGGSVSERLQAAGQTMGLPQGVVGEAAVSLSGFMGRVESMARDAQGQKILQDALGRLQALTGGGDQLGPTASAPDVTEASLEAARVQDPALAQTFAGVAPEDLKAASLLLAFTQVRASLDRGNTPFNKDLGLLLDLVGENDPALRESLLRLAPQAEKGILTPAGLATQFKSMAGDAVVASLQGEDVSFEERAMARLNQVLQVEKDGELVTGTDTQAKIARAQAALDAGDVETAVTELEGLDGPAAQTARPWIDQAQAVIAADQIKQMFSGLVSGVSPIGGASGAKYTARSKGFSGLIPQPVI
ncbi:MAG TPA: mitofilin family membrane protein, partial [Alphaproteobacteria bacterium]|nr:mitofilin family membrane protein [Alphaproteobacteria bacterium]